MAEQKSIVAIVLCVVVAGVLLFLAVPCCVSGFIAYKFQQEKEAQQKAIQREQSRP